jgi:hypothetical protein
MEPCGTVWSTGTHRDVLLRERESVRGEARVPQGERHASPALPAGSERDVCIVKVARPLVRLRGTVFPAGEELHAVRDHINLAEAVAVFLPLVPPQAPVNQ